MNSYDPYLKHFFENITNLRAVHRPYFMHSENIGIIVL